jgi:hypothetical protein
MVPFSLPQKSGDFLLPEPGSKGLLSSANRNAPQLTRTGCEPSTSKPAEIMMHLVVQERL